MKDPTDLESMREQFLRKKYANAQEFVDEVALMFENADLYNKVLIIENKYISNYCI